MADTTAATQAAAPVPDELSGEKMVQSDVLMLGLVFLIFYFLLLRPQQKRHKAHRDLLKSLTKGHKVITNGGLIGSITKLEGEDIVIVEVAPNVRVRVARSAVSEVLDDKTVLGESANDN